ncbi:MAG TPA: ATP-binding protein [Chloroflexia bacterium]|nr:ATP-binding protein [Chloroflexia bacterium]
MMTEMNDIEINIPSDHVFERIVRDSAVVVARYLGFAEERTADLQLAVSEAVTNAIEHGNKGRIDVKVGVHFLLQHDRLAVRVIDQGGNAPADLTHQPAPHMEEKLAEDSPRGLGIFLIQQLVDGVELHSGEGRTEFTMWFNLKETPAEEIPPAAPGPGAHPPPGDEQSGEET